MAKAMMLGVLAAASPLLSAHAAPATPEEAARLTAVFERYVGHAAPGQPGSVTVTPKGDSYVAALDLKRVMTGFGSPQFSMEPYVSTLTLTPSPDGTWKVSTDASPPLVMHFGEQTIAFRSATAAFNGIYDPAIGTFRQSSSSYTAYSYAQTAPNVIQNQQIEKLDLSSMGKPADGGTASTTVHYAATGLKADLLIKSPPPAPDPVVPGNPAVPPPVGTTTSISYASPSSRVDFGFDRLHVKEALDLWAFLVAHPDHDSMVGAKDQLRAMVRAGLPFAEAIQESASLDGLTVSTPVGPFSTKTFTASVDLKGLAGKGTMATSLSFDGLAIPPGQLPPWSMDFVPTSLALNVGVDGFHASEAAQEAAADFDPASAKGFTTEQSDKISHLFWPPAGGTLTLAPSRLTSKLLDLKIEGRAALDASPSGTLTVTGTGLDKAIAALQSAAGSDPSASQFLGPLVLAKNLGKPQPDGSLVWVIAAGNGPLTVNGAPLQ